jgi:hypothetical protein
MERIQDILAPQGQQGRPVQVELRHLVDLFHSDASALRLGFRPLQDLQRQRHAQALVKLEWTRPTADGLVAAVDAERSFLIANKAENCVLLCIWRNYGATLLKTGTSVAELRDVALQHVRDGGPFGGPTPNDSDLLALPWDEWHRMSRGIHRRGGWCSEFVLDTAYDVRRDDDDHELVVAYRDGTFAIAARGADRNLIPLGDKLARDKQLRDRLPPLTVRLGELVVPWRYLDRPLFKGIIPTPATDLLLLSLAKGKYGLICSQGDGEYAPLAVRSIDDIQNFDVAPILAELMGHRELATWLRLSELAPPRPNGASVPQVDAEPARSRQQLPEASPPGAPPTRAVPSRHAGGASAPERAPAQSQVNAEATRTRRPLPDASPTSAPPTRAAPPLHSTGSAPNSPPIDGEQVVLQHLKLFLQSIPHGQGGSATARALVAGIAQGFLLGWGSIEGTWKEVFEPFIENSLIDDLPSDKTARATFGILKASPIYRRIDTQHHRLCLDECRDPKSEVFQAILREYLQREQ